MTANVRTLLAARLMKRLAQRPRKGFTLIELLVVVVIIGILASVALPSFVGAQDKARNSAVQGNINTVRMALEQYSTDNNGSFPTKVDAIIGTNGGNYLPGNKMPKSPWTNNNQATNIGLPSGAPAATAISAGTGTIPLQSTINANGKVPTSAPTLSTEYGAIEYDLDTGSQVYVVMATGKKNKAAIVAAGVSNGGQ